MLLFEAWNGVNTPKYVPFKGFAASLHTYYLEDHRTYHNVGHINAGINFATDVNRYHEGQEECSPYHSLTLAQQLAWLAHDIVCLPISFARNEAASVRLLKVLIAQHPVANERDLLEGAYAEAKSIILATRDHQSTAENAAPIIDMDLSCFINKESLKTANRCLFIEYGKPENFEAKRAEWLSNFLSTRRRIFSTDAVHQMWGTTARRTIKAYIDEVEGR